MKKLLCSLVLILSVATAFSQKVYFIYIQADLEQPFSVKMNEKIYHSSSSGYLILSKLKDSTYPLTVLFPQGKWPDQAFKIEVRSKDRGFLLKNFGDKGWGLYDLQTLSVQMSTTNGIAEGKAEAKDVSTFTDVLSRAANDPSLREKPAAIQQAVVREEKKPEPVAAKKNETKTDADVVKKDETQPAAVQPALAKQEPVQEKPKPAVTHPPVESVEKNDPPVVWEVVKEERKAEEEKTVEVPQEYKPSVVKKRRAESSTSEGLGLTFIDEYADGKRDTIRILIPNPKRVVKDETKQDKKFLDITAETKDVTPPEVKTAVTEQKEEVKEVKEEVKKPAACTSLATDNDFLKLRRRMAAESGDDDMVSEGVKYFKSRCFTVSQVKNLSTLFLNDAGKYKFFDAAYGHVSDPENFATLQPELKDEYYVNRFKAMMR
jgi:hypothetical protein